MSMPVASTRPAEQNLAAAESGGVFMYFHCMQAIVTSSMASPMLRIQP